MTRVGGVGDVVSAEWPWPSVVRRAVASIRYRSFDQPLQPFIAEQRVDLPRRVADMRPQRRPGPVRANVPRCSATLAPLCQSGSGDASEPAIPSQELICQSGLFVNIFVNLFSGRR